MCHSATGLGFPRSASLAHYQRTQRLLYLEEESMGNIDLLKGIHSCFTFQGEDGMAGQRSHLEGCLWLVGPSVLQAWYKLPAYVLLLNNMFIQYVQVQASRRNVFIFCWQRQQPRSTNIKHNCLLV